MTDQMVLKTQQWLNRTYKGRTGFGSVPEDGHTGWDTINGLIRALQIELGITATANNFGPGTQSRFNSRWPNGISKNPGSSNVHGIIQGALWCKGYPAEYGGLTTKFTDNMASYISKMKADIGLSDTSSTVDVELMMALLSMKQFRLLSAYGGKASIRAIQQRINHDYKAYTGILPTDGIYGREMNTGLIQVLQALEGFTPEQATGNFGNGTRSRLKTVSSGSGDWVWLASAGLVCNGQSSSVTRTWDARLAAQVRTFQADYALPVTGKVDPTTWMSLLTSKGDPNRACKACDCATVLNAQQAKDLKAAGYTHVGRYLTGYVGKDTSKALTQDEVKNITDAGLAVFPIYQDGGYYQEYFANSSQGTIDAVTAISAAQRIGIPSGVTIYFAVDFDAYEFQIDSMILPYFRQIKAAFNSSKNRLRYKVGVYGPRLVCAKVSEAGYASFSFVGDMSTGFSGNLGYAIPDNWAFDQFHEFTFPSSPSFPLDKDAYSGRDRGVSSFVKVPAKTPEELEEDNRRNLLEIARETFVRRVLEPLGYYPSFSSVGWEYGQTLELGNVHTPTFDMKVSAHIATQATTSSNELFSTNITVNNAGELSASTLSSIDSASATFDVKDFGSNGDFASKIKRIAGSVKSGNISYGLTVVDPTSLQVWIRVDSDNLASGNTAVKSTMSVTVTYEVTLHSTLGVELRLPEVSGKAVAVAVGVVALVALAAVVVVVAPEAGLVGGLVAIGAAG